MLWKKLEEWAESVHGLVRDLGMQDSVMTVDELSTGDEVRGTGMRFDSAGFDILAQTKSKRIPAKQQGAELYCADQGVWRAQP